MIIDYFWHSYNRNRFMYLDQILMYYKVIAKKSNTLIKYNKNQYILIYR